MIEKNKNRYNVVEVPIKTQPVFVDTSIEDKTKQQVDMYDIIAKIANDVEIIKKSLTN